MGACAPRGDPMDYLSYQDPNNRGGSSKLLIFMGMMLVIFIIMPYIMPQQPQQDQNTQQQTVQQTVLQAAETPTVRVTYPIETRSIETDAYNLTLTNAGGGRVESFFIKDPDRYSFHKDFIRSQKPQDNTKGGLLPLETSLKSFGIDNDTQFKTVSDANDHASAQFTYSDPQNLYQFDKTFTATDTPYVIHAKFSLTNRSSQDITDVLAISMYIKQIEGEEPGLFTPGSYVAAKCYSDDKMEYLDATDKNENESFQKSLKWFAVDESYFAIAMNAAYASSCELRNDDGLLKSTLNVPVTLKAGTTSTYEYDIYMGPKESKYLDYFGEDRNLPSIIDYGWMEVLAKPMAWILDKFHDWTGNWGIAIIILTLIVRILLWPVAQKSQLSMMRMSKIAPLMQEIQEKYKDDPATMQQKQLELYKTHKINPFGCLPLLLQMPIFFALYRCIFVTGGLYHAPFVLWIQDLSAPDPFFILPILSVVLLILQQVLTPSTTKNLQQKIMMYSMPAIFGLMMLFLPSGLCLYMVVSSTFSMAQSFYVRRIIAKENDGDNNNNNGSDDVIDVESLSSKDKRAAKRRETNT